MGGKNMNPIILNQETLAEILIKCSDFIVKAPRLIFNNNVPELSAKEKFFYSETVTSQKAENNVGNLDNARVSMPAPGHVRYNDGVPAILITGQMNGTEKPNYFLEGDEFVFESDRIRILSKGSGNKKFNRIGERLIEEYIKV